MPSILFAHTNYPAQFGAFGQWLTKKGWDVAFVTSNADAADKSIKIEHGSAHRDVSAGIHPYARPFEQGVLNGQGLVRAAAKLKSKGFKPDIIVAHSGWGAGMWLPDLFPNAAFITFVEWWYKTPAPDAAFLERILGSKPNDLDTTLSQSGRNAPMAFDCARADAIWCPTHFQASQLPNALQARIHIDHDGIDCDLHVPAGDGFDKTLDGLVPADATVFTYATRGQEPHRGFPQAIGALSYALKNKPNSYAVVVGANRVAYGGAETRAIDWRKRAINNFKPDLTRLLFLDTLPRDKYINVLQRSQGHLYLTAPFVLSWSMLEAMAIGVPLVASDTDPVKDYVENEKEGLLRNFFDHKALGRALLDGCEDVQSALERGKSARSKILNTVNSKKLWPERNVWLRSLIKDKKARNHS